jgi:hypothetical protein
MHDELHDAFRQSARIGLGLSLSLQGEPEGTKELHLAPSALKAQTAEKTWKLV